LQYENRYEYFIHANQEMIDTFTADLETCGPVEEGDYAFGAVGWGVTYFLYVVYASLVPMEPFSQKQNWHEGYGGDGIEDDEDDNDDEIGNFSKKIRKETLLSVYARLLDGFDIFYQDESKEGFWVIA
jgi:hypothetical protein